MDDMFENDEMQEILNDFLVEAGELLESIDQQLVELEQTPEDLDLLNSIFRSVHTIKGAAGFLALNQVVELAHKAEEVLNKLRQGTLKMTSTKMDALLAAADILTVLIGHVKARSGAEEDLGPILAQLKEAEDEGGGEGEEAAAEKTEEAALTSAEPEPSAEPQAEPEPELNAPEAAAPAAEPEPVKAAEPQKKEAPKAPKQAVAKGPVEEVETIRVDTTRLDSVMNMVGELVLGRNRLMRLSTRLAERFGEDDLLDHLAQTAAQLSLITTDLQLSVMKTRMQPVAKVFGKFPRMVRDLSKEKGKLVTLELVGQETELDKTVIEEIGDPLVHMIRNAVDHGIELPDVREAAGKPKGGTVVLSAFHKGNNIFITIEDDGKGLDAEVLKAKAVEKGLISSKEEADRLTDKDAFNLIFHPGFSTAAAITDTSGRGVGMDVVKTNIMKLNGSVDIESTLGEGSKMIMRLPLTLAIIHALMVGIGDDEYALPLSSVVEILHIQSTEIKTVEGKEALYFRERVYPLLRLGHLVETEGEANTSTYAVLMSHGDKVFGLLVDKLIGQEEVVIKSMGNYLSNIKGVSGATITGDGRVVLIVDIVAMLASLQGK